MFDLRPYQQEVVDKVYAAWETVRVPLVVLPTGAGKTVVFSSIIRDHKGASAAVVHRKEIVGQISLSLAKLGVKHRIVAPPKTVQMIRKKHLKALGKSFIDPNALCGVASVQTLTSPSAGKDAALQRWVKQVSLAVWDEAHHYVATGTWARAVEMMGDVKMLMVTATPERADGQGLGAHADGYAETLIEGPTTAWLIENGFLARFRYISPESDFDVADLVATASGDFSSKALRGRVVESSLVGDVVQHYRRFTPGKRAIVFATDVQTAHEMADAFVAAGITAVALSGKTDAAERDRELEKFECGRTRVLLNVGLFDEGFDVPAVEVVILACPTFSLAKYLQMVGRGLRTMEGKTEAIVLDPVRNWERLGTMPNWPRVWSLDRREKSTKSKSDTVPQKVCTGCSQVYEAFYKSCPFCGETPVPAVRSTPDKVEGDLFELDVEGMAALFDKMNKADMPDDEYAAEQVSRNIPPIGRPADLRRHKDAKYRRKVLNELVKWWVGMRPPGRELSEMHRRFYYRYNIDIGMAFTLNAKDTDALIERIQQHFHEDLV